MKGIITIDVGTTSMRAILYDTAGQILHIHQQENAPEFFVDGRVEQAPQAWESILTASLKACADAAHEKNVEPLCISVTAQRSSVIPVDADGTPLHPAIMWQDRRTADMTAAMEVHNPLVYGKTGLKISPVFSAIKMAWFRENRPDIWQKAHKMIGIQDWVLYLLSGRFVTDHTFGSRTNLFDLKRRCWDDDLLALFGVEKRMLCDLVPPGAIVGGVTKALSAATGIVAGLPVVSAGGDQQCAALGLGLFSRQRAVSNTGTGSYLIGHADHPVFDEHMRLVCNVSAVPDAYIVEAAVLTSGAVYRWFHEAFYDRSTSFAEIDAEAASGENIEIKTVSPFKAKEWGEQQSDEIPVHYAAQAMHALMITGRALCVFGVLIGADDFRIYRIERDDVTIAAIRAKEIAFWKRVQDRNPPDPSTVSDVFRLFGTHDSGAAIAANDAIQADVLALKSLKADAKSLEGIIAMREERIKLYMGDAAILTMNGTPSITWKEQQSKRFDQAAFKADHPDLFEKFTKVAASRVFRIR